MQITDMTTTKAGRISLFLDGEFYRSFNADIVYAAGLKIDTFLEDDALQALTYQSDCKDAKSYALLLLSRRAYSEKALYDKISGKYSEEAAAAALQRMDELDLLDDPYLAAEGVRQLRAKGHGTRRIRQELLRRGLSESDIDTALEEAPETDERVCIADILARKYPAAFSEDSIRRRAVGALMRLGYNYEDIGYVLRHPDEFLDY